MNKSKLITLLLIFGLLSVVSLPVMAQYILKTGPAEEFAGIIGCDSEEYKQALEKIKTVRPDATLDCVRSTSQDENSAYYTINPLTCNLQTKGYDLGIKGCGGKDCKTVSDVNAVIANANLPISERSKAFVLKSTNELSSSFVSLVERIEKNTCLPPGILLGMLTSEDGSSQSVLKSLSGDPRQVVNRGGNTKVAWGLANFTNIAWRVEKNPAYGKSDGYMFNGSGRPPAKYTTEQCLKSIGINDYATNTALQESSGPVYVLSRGVVGYALCGAAVKIKNDSGTGDKCNNWSFEEVSKSALAYSGICDANTRSYCAEWSGTMCSIHGAENGSLCGAANANQQGVSQCTTDISFNNTCKDNNIRLLHPLNNTKAQITQTWGNSSKAGQHSGVDFAAALGTPVFAANDGVIIRTFSNWNNNCITDKQKASADCTGGNFVAIAHTTPGGKAYYTSYQHLSAVSVSVGQKVLAGTQIGLSGNTGNSSGPHLHFEYRFRDCSDGYNDPVNPFTSCTADPLPLIQGLADIVSCK